MPQPIEFFFDFSSPYGYIASRLIDDLGAKHGREVIWKPILLGAIFKLTGMAPLTTIPLKGDYVEARFSPDRAFPRRPVRDADTLPLLQASRPTAPSIGWTAPTR